MYQYVLIYRIGQKEILNRHVSLCEQLIPIISEFLDSPSNKTDWPAFYDVVGPLRITSNMSDYFDDLKKVYDL